MLRFEAAYPLYGHELDEMHTPFESGTAWATKLAKGEFVGSHALVKQKQDTILERLVGIRMTEPRNAIARDGYSIYDSAGEGPIGSVTSGTLSPTSGQGIAMARVQHRLSKPGTEVQVRFAAAKRKPKSSSCRSTATECNASQTYSTFRNRVAEES